MILDDLMVFLPTGSMGLSEPHVELARGERILVVGAPGSGKTLPLSLHRHSSALGLGSHQAFVERLRDVHAQASLYPNDALDRILAYPEPLEAFQNEQFLAVLTRLGLGYPAPHLRRAARWDEELTHEEQPGLTFARPLLHEPDCVIVDEATEALPPEMCDVVFDVLAKEGASTSLLVIGRPRAMDPRCTRVLRLNFNSEGTPLARFDESTKGG